MRDKQLPVVKMFERSVINLKRRCFYSSNLMLILVTIRLPLIICDNPHQNHSISSSATRRPNPSSVNLFKLSTLEQNNNDHDDELLIDPINKTLCDCHTHQKSYKLPYSKALRRKGLSGAESRRIMTLSGQDNNQQTDIYSLSSNVSSSMSRFRAPKSAELVVDPIAKPILNMPRQSVNSTPFFANSSRIITSTASTDHSDLTMSKNKHLKSDAFAGGQRWHPISNKMQSIEGSKLAPSLQVTANLNHYPSANKYINIDQLISNKQATEQTPIRQRRFSLLSNPNNIAAHHQTDQMKDLQESAHTAEVQLASPISRYLLQQLLAGQQHQPSSTSHKFQKILPFLPQPELGIQAHIHSLLPRQEQNLQQMGTFMAALNNEQNATPFGSNLIEHPIQGAGLLSSKPTDIGEDGSSMVTYSLIPNDRVSRPNQLQNPLERPESSAIATSASPGIVEQNIIDGLSQEQLMNLVTQLGGQQQNNPQQNVQPIDSSSQPLTPPTNVLDSALMSVFENLFKTSAANSAQTQIQASQGLIGAEQQDPLHQQQQAIAQLTTSINKQQQSGQTNQNKSLNLINDQHNTNEIKFPQAATPNLNNNHGSQTMPVPIPQPLNQISSSDHHHHQNQAIIYPQDSIHDPMYASYPKRRSKKKRKKSDKSDGVKSPTVRIAKRPRAGPQQQFYEHNSPTDLQPSATFHRWKYPWLYRPYDDDEDEEEGETEINLRFFNNFSRMGPFQGIARSAAPVTFIISLVFLILSNVSLAATVIVHGISTFLRSLSSQQQQVGSSPSPHKVSGRLAKLLSAESYIHMPNYSIGMTTTTSKPKAKMLNDTTTIESTTKPEHPKATKLDRVIRSFSKAWELKSQN